MARRMNVYEGDVRLGSYNKHVGVVASNYKQAIKRAGHNVGTLNEPATGVWVAKMYAQWVILVTKEDPTTIGVDKLTNLVNKSGVIKDK